MEGVTDELRYELYPLPISALTAELSGDSTRYIELILLYCRLFSLVI